MGVVGVVRGGWGCWGRVWGGVAWRGVAWREVGRDGVVGGVGVVGVVSILVLLGVGVVGVFSTCGFYYVFCFVF